MSSAQIMLRSCHCRTSAWQGRSDRSSCGDRALGDGHGSLLELPDNGAVLAPVTPHPVPVHRKIVHSLPKALHPHTRLSGVDLSWNYCSTNEHICDCAIGPVWEPARAYCGKEIVLAGVV